MQKIYIFFIFTLLANQLMAIDKIFQFPSNKHEGRIEFQKKRKFCIFPFRNKSEEMQMPKENGLDYLAVGLPSILKSSLATFFYIYEKEPRFQKIYHSSEGETKFIPEKNLLPGKDPRYVPLAVVLLEKEEPDSAGFISGRKKSCDYVMSGSFFRSGEDQISVEVEMLEMFDGRRKVFKRTLSLKRGLQELASAEKEVKDFLINGVELLAFRANANENDALVFIDGYFAGKTPLDRNDIPEGIHKIRLFKEGFKEIETVIQVKKDNYKFLFNMEKLEQDGIISIKSDPDEADVFLGKENLGKTPIENKPVRVGMNRLRISKKGFVDYLTGLDIVKGKKTLVNISLKEGDTVKYYTDSRYLFQDYTPYDFSIYSFYSVLLFYAGAITLDLKANTLQEGLRPRISIVTPLLAYTAVAGSPQAFNDSYAIFVFEEYLIRNNKKKVDRIRNQASISAASGGVMVILGFVFMIMGLNNESFDFAMINNRNLNEPVSYVGYKINF